MFFRTIPRSSNKFDNSFSCMVRFRLESSDSAKKNYSVGLLLNSVVQSLIQSPTKAEREVPLHTLHILSVFNQ